MFFVYVCLSYSLNCLIWPGVGHGCLYTCVTCHSNDFLRSENEFQCIGLFCPFKGLQLYQYPPSPPHDIHAHEQVIALVQVH